LTSQSAWANQPGVSTSESYEPSSAAETLCIRGEASPLIIAELNGSGRGDLYVHVDVKVPSRLTKEQRKLFEQLRESLPVDNAPAEKGLFEKVKDYFM